MSWMLMPARGSESENHNPAYGTVVRDEDLLFVSERVTDWRKLLRYLLSNDQYCNVEKEIEELDEKQRRKSLQICDCTRQALEIWRRRKGNRAMISDLFNVLVKIGRTDVMERLEVNLVTSGKPLY